MNYRNRSPFTSIFDLLTNENLKMYVGFTSGSAHCLGEMVEELGLEGKYIYIESV